MKDAACPLCARLFSRQLSCIDSVKVTVILVSLFLSSEILAAKVALCEHGWTVYRSRTFSLPAVFCGSASCKLCLHWWDVTVSSASARCMTGLHHAAPSMSTVACTCVEAGPAEHAAPHKCTENATGAVSRRCQVHPPWLWQPAGCQMWREVEN